MEATMTLNASNIQTKERLASLVHPQNAILARLQNCIKGSKNENVVCSYSRMHNRHNRS